MPLLGNCLVVALVYGGLRTRRAPWPGSLHFYWRDRAGKAWHFTYAGTSKPICSLLFFGQIEAIPERQLRVRSNQSAVTA